MKYITLSLFFAASLCLPLGAFAQDATTDNNGRESGARSAAVTETPPPTFETLDEDRVDDRDIPGELRESTEDIFLPQAIEELRDELYNSASVPEVVAEVEALKTVLLEVQLTQEKLQRENELLRKQLNSCCSAAAQGLTAKDAYLLQNAPNPFQTSTKLEYFLPEVVTDAQLEIRDLKGVTLQSFELTTKGLANLQLDAAQWPVGAYVYILVVEGEAVDSKVMILK